MTWHRTPPRFRFSSESPSSGYGYLSRRTDYGAVMTRVGFIGLGSQGGPMARRIASEFPLTLWARRQEALTPYADTGADFAPTAAALGAASDVVGICVVADTDVEDVILR